MVTEYQKKVIRQAISQAQDKDIEIKKLAKGMHISEDVIHKVLDDSSPTTLPVPAPPAPVRVPKPQPPKAPQKAQRSTRIFWTDDMLKQLAELSTKGEEPTHIAKIMGLEVKQVVNKLSRKPDPHTIPSEPEQKEAKEPINPEEVKEPDPIQNPFGSLGSMASAIRKAFSPFSSCEEPDAEEEEKISIDMPTAVYRMAKLVHDNFSKNIIRIYGSNEEHSAACSFEVDGTEYEIKLEVIE